MPAQSEEHDMPGNPRECRKHAVACMELARTAQTPDYKQLLTDLAQSWINFAAEIERTQVLLGQHGERGNGLDRSGAPGIEATQH